MKSQSVKTIEDLFPVFAPDSHCDVNLFASIFKVND